MVEEDRKNPKGAFLESSKQQVLEFLQEVLSDPQKASELEFPVRIPQPKQADKAKEDGKLQDKATPRAAAKQEAKADPAPDAKKPASVLPASRSKRKAKPSQATFTLAKAIYSIFINTLLFFATFFILYLVTFIPGFTRFNRLHFSSEISIDLLLLPLWFNIGCAIGSAAILFGLTIGNKKCRLGLVIGTPAGLMALISNYMEGYVGEGMFFGFGAGVLCVALVLICFVKSVGLGDVLRISCVALLSVLVVVGPAFHFFAALAIGLPVALATQVVLSICILISKV